MKNILAKLSILILLALMLANPLLVRVGSSTGSVRLYSSSYLGLMETGDQYIHFDTEKVFSEIYRKEGYWYLLEPGSSNHWRIRAEADVTIYTLTTDTLEAYSNSAGQHILRIYNPYNPSSTVQATVNGEDWTDNVSYIHLGNGEYIVELNNISPGNNIQIIISWTSIPIPEPWIIPAVTIAAIILALLASKK